MKINFFKLIAANELKKIFLLGMLVISTVDVASAAGTLDWGVEGYTPDGATTQNYNGIGTPGIDVDVVVNDNVPPDLDDFNPDTPSINSSAIILTVNFENRTEGVSLDFNFSEPVSNLAFNIHDIDSSNVAIPTIGVWRDQVTVTGTGPNGPATVTITPGAHYNVAGNVITGNGPNVAFGSFTPIVFNDPVTTITVAWTNAPDTQANPGGQVIWIDDFTWDNEADLEIIKDDGSLTYTPGGTGVYTLTVTNNGPGPVSAASIVDNLPNGVTLSGSWSCTATSGSTCSSTSGGSVGGGVVSLTADLVNDGVATITIPVQFSSDMNVY